MQATDGGIGFPASRRGLDVSAGPCGVSSPAVHLRLAPGASSSRELSASSRVLRPATCPPRLDVALRPNSTGERLPWGPVPHRGVSWRRPPLPRESRPRGHVPSSPFLTASRVCSASSLCGLVSSRCHVQGLPSRGLSLSAEPYRVSPADSCPRVVGRISLRFDPRQPLRPRLQGLAPRGECGADRDGLGLDRSAPLLGFSLPRVLPPHNVQAPSHPLRPRPSLR